MPKSVRSYPNNPPFVLVASLNPEILPFLETPIALYFCQCSSACPSLFSAHHGRVLTAQVTAPLRDSALALAPCGLPWQPGPGFQVSRFSFLGLCGLLLPALLWGRLTASWLTSKLAARPGCSKTKKLDPLEKR
jgi:hypothetical protein